MVSPLDKNGGNIDRDYINWEKGGTTQFGASQVGDAVAFASRLQFGDLESGAIAPTYVARRAPDGWSTEGVTPPIPGQETGTVERPNVLALSSDLWTTVVHGPAVLTADALLLGGTWGVYMRTADKLGGPPRYTLVTAPGAQLAADTDLNLRVLRFDWEASTPDARHLVFNSTRQLLPDAPGDITGSKPNAVYEWTNGTVRLVSVPPAGFPFDPAASEAVVAGSGAARLDNGALHGDHVISDDGRRVFFSARLVDGGGATAGTRLMVREDGLSTRFVSASERAADPPGTSVNAQFWSARSTDGAVAFFKSDVPLTEGAGVDSLYRWDADAPEGESLTELAADLGGSGDAGPAAVNDDATAVYFVTRGELRRWKEGEGVRPIATLDVTRDASMWLLERADGGRAARVSADGERLLFASYAQLDPSYDTTEASAGDCGDVTVKDERCRQIYLYDAPSDQIHCLTCVPGLALTGDANLFGDDGQKAPLQLPRNLSADGTRAFFETDRRLVPHDNNGSIDVYGWEDGDRDGNGELHLISSGRGPSDALFVDASVSGDNVFFTTRERLVGVDSDDQVDLYDARVGGGIPAQNPPPTRSCVGEECQGAPSGPPALTGIGSAFSGIGNVRPGTRPSFAVARLSRAQRSRLANGRRAVLRVRVNRAGRVSVTARATVGGKSRVVGTASTRARRAGRVEVGVRLSSRAQSELARKGRLGVTLAVRFAGVREVRSTTVRLVRTSTSDARRAQ